MFGRIPTPPVLSTAVTGISTIFSFFITVAPLALIVGGVVSLGVKLVPSEPTIYDWLVFRADVTDAAYTLPLAASCSVILSFNFTLAVICIA